MFFLKSLLDNVGVSVQFAVLTSCLSIGCGVEHSEVNIPDSSIALATPTRCLEALNNMSDASDENRALRMLLQYRRLSWDVTEDEINRTMNGVGNHAMVLQLLSEYYLSREDHYRADSINRVLKIHKEASPLFYKILSETSSQLGEFGLAVDQVNKALLVDRKDPDLYEQKGLIYLAMGDTLSSIKYLKRAVDQNPANATLAIRIAQVLASKGDAAEAEIYLNNLTDELKESTEVKMILAEIKFGQGDISGAHATWKSLLESGYLPAGYKLLETSERQSVDSLLRYANGILAIDSLDKRSLLVKAYAFDQKGYYNSSVDYFEKVLSMDSLNADARDGLAKVNRKIAYLRKIRERRASVPTLDFAPSRKKNVISNE